MLKMLRRIIQEVNNAKDLITALNTVVQSICEITNAEICSVFLIDEDQGEYVLTATAGLKPKLIGKYRIKLGENLVGLVGERETPINIANAGEHPKFVHAKKVTSAIYPAFLGVPIIHQREVLGVLVAQKLEPTCFTTNEEAFLLTLVVQLSELIAANRTTATMAQTKTQDLVFNGMPCVLGVGIGITVIAYPSTDLEAVPDKKTDNPKQQIAAFKAALKAAYDDIVTLERNLVSKVTEDEQVLFDAYLQILDSPSLKKDVIKEIRAGNWAPGALKRAIKTRVVQFEVMDDDYLRERAVDLRDLGRRILTHLQTTDYQVPAYPENTILIGEEITPSTIMEVPEGHLAGIVSIKGSHNSHTAILARALGIPTIMGIPDLPLTQLENKAVIIDGYYGQLYISPNKNTHQEFVNLAAQEQELDRELTGITNLPAETIDGHAIALLINTGLPFDLKHSLHVGAQGVGLYRTEVPFITRDYFPAEAEQKTIYQKLLKTFAPLPVVMRTLDVGGDKALSYLTIKEDNPALGWRGLRLTLDHPELFLIQIKAMLRANLGLNNLQIMLPMISSLAEIEKAMRLIKQAHAELAEENPNIMMPPIGAMIEVPSAVYQAQNIARQVDFLSVGSNDLTQYLLAVDRNNIRVANLYDSLHPAVLQALIQVVKAAHKEKNKVSICGEMAGDPAAIILLLAMGFDSLSMNANQLLRAKWLIRKFTMAQAQNLLNEVMQMDDPVEIRYHLEVAIEDAGAAGLIRAGK